MNKIRMNNREWSNYLWSRIKTLFSNLDTRVTIQEQAGYITEETDPTVPSWAKAPNKPTYTAAEVGAIPANQKGAASGVAELDGDGKIPTSQLPSYVDDVLEYSNVSAFPSEGESGKIYVAKNANSMYRWNGTAYVELSPSLLLGETSSTAYRGDRGKLAYDHSQAIGNPHHLTLDDLGIADIIRQMEFIYETVGASDNWQDHDDTQFVDHDGNELVFHTDARLLGWH